MADHNDDYECDGEVCRPKRKFGAKPAAEPEPAAEPTPAPAGSQGALEQLFGKEVLGKSGMVPTSTFVGKYIFIYFSAAWCSPCRQFLPRLKDFYGKFHGSKNFELFWVSSDNDQAAFDGYYAQMPWFALPYNDRSRKVALSRKFKVQGIPTLVLLNPDGTLITTEARMRVTEDASGEGFPWKPLTPLQTLGTSFLSKSGPVDKSAIEGKYVAIYFSASWCGPCRAFLPALRNVYKKLQAENKPFELVWVSFDRDQRAFDNYYNEMPWLTIPYSDRKRAMALASLWNVEGIPTLVMVGPNDKTVNPNARPAIMQDPEGTEFPWAPKPVQTITEAAEYLNEETCVIACVASLGERARDSAFEALEQAAKLLPETELKFVVADERNSIVQQIRALTHLGDISKPHLIIVDIPDGGAWYDCGPEITADAVVEAAAKYKSSQLKRYQLGR